MNTAMIFLVGIVIGLIPCLLRRKNSVGCLRLYDSKEEGTYMYLELQGAVNDIRDGDKMTLTVERINVDYLGEAGHR